MSLDDEAERLARLTGWNGRSEVTPSTFQLNGERPKPPKVPEDVLRARADADIERMWAEDDGKIESLIIDGERVPITGVLTDQLRIKAGAMFGVDPSRVTAAQYDDNGSFFAWYISSEPASHNDYLKPGFGNRVALKTKPAGKTYVRPGRKAGKAWIDRLNQSKQAKKR